MKKLTAMLLALMVVISLATCSNTGNDTKDKNTDNPGSATQGGGNDTQQDGTRGDQDYIVLWTLPNDLKQFAEHYEGQTGNHEDVVVFDSTDFSTKIKGAGRYGAVR